MTIFHAVTCTRSECERDRWVPDPKRPGRGVWLPGCPIGDPAVRGPVTVVAVPAPRETLELEFQ